MRRAPRPGAPLAARGIHLQHHDNAHDPARDLKAATGALYRSCHARTLDTTAVRAQTRPAPPAARDAGVPHRPRRLLAFPHTRDSAGVYVLPSPPNVCVCRTRRHHFHHLLRAQRVRWPIPIAGAAFIASSRAKCVSSKYRSPPSTRAPGASSVRHAPPPACAAPVAAAPHRPCRGYHLPASRQRVQRLTILRSKSAPIRQRGTTRSLTTRSLAASATSVPRRPGHLHRLPRAASILCAHAALRSKPRPAAHR
ncbi:hypothetical protein B0H19DRAFT_605327 [Mycena capillaripes]|nr:hypothetical protein B0H19DRAFT_605327 [Mycena capillaripes]